MKKLMITLSAAALAFGLHADEGPLAGEAFTDRTEVPATITSRGESSIGTTPFVPSDTDAGVPDQFVSEGDGNNLIIKTKLDAPAYYEPTELASGVTMNGLYFDSMVKFTACDEDAVVPAGSGAKIMVWVKEDETAGTTNLMVTAGYFEDSANTIVAKNYNCGSVAGYGIDMEKWSRLTIKAYDEITTRGDGVGGFVLFVNAKTVTISTEKAIGVTGSYADHLTKVLKLRTAAVFPSLAEPGTTTVTGVGFAGQGAVDDLSFTTKAPTTDGDNSFVEDPVPAIATVDGVEVGNIDALNDAIAAAVGGAEVVLVDDIAGDIVFENGAANTLDLNGFTLNGGFMTADVGEMVTTTLTLTDAVGTGSVEDKCSIGGAENVLFNGGKIKADVNESLNWYLTPATGMNIDNVEGYWQLVEPLEDGTAAKPWTIKTAEDLQNKLLDKLSSLDAAHQNFVQTDDIYIEEGTWPGIGVNMKEHGKTEAAATKIGAFLGVYDGGNYTVSGVKFAKDKTYKGFFNSLSGKAVVKNLTVICEDFVTGTGDKTEWGAGIIAGSISGESMISNCVSKGTLNTCHNGAGIVAKVTWYTNSQDKVVWPTIVDCRNEADVTNDLQDNPKAGGIVCLSEGANVIRCVNTGAIKVNYKKVYNSAGGAVGGLVAYSLTKKLTITGGGNSGVISVGDGVTTHEGTKYDTYCGSIIGNPNVETEIADGVYSTADVVSYGKNPSKVTGFKFATVNGTVATAVSNLDKTGNTQYKVMAEGAAVSLALNDSIDLDETLKKATVSAADAANNKVTKSDTVYTCVAKPAVTTVTLAVATVEYGTTVAPEATVKDADGKEIAAANYDLSYSPALTATTAVGTEITVTATAKGDDYVGSASAKFTVVAKAITVGVTINGKIADEATWTATLQLPTPVITGVDGLTAGTDYDAGWAEGPILPETNPEKDIVFTYTVTPKGNYSGEPASATFTVKPAAGGDIPTDPEKDITEDTKPTDLGLDANGPFKDAGKAELIKLSKWANKAEKKAADINAGIAFDEAGNPTTEMAEAYLLDCGVDGVEAAKEAFKFNADDLAAVLADPTSLTTLNGNSYNGTIQVKAFSDAACKTPAEGDLDAKFYKAVLVK